MEKMEFNLFSSLDVLLHMPHTWYDVVEHPIKSDIFVVIWSSFYGGSKLLWRLFFGVLLFGGFSGIIDLWGFFDVCLIVVICMFVLVSYCVAE